jgi:hypothetical protein
MNAVRFTFGLPVSVVGIGVIIIALLRPSGLL